MADPPELTRTSGDGRLILLVEDNADNQAIYRLILEHHGFEVILADRGDEAVKIAREKLPHLILMDISLPIMDGLEATRILKGDGVTRHIPIIALTAHALVADRKKALEVGCDGYLAKPVEPQRAVQAVLEMLQRSPLY